MKQSINDVGWMYHSFPVKRNRKPVGYPPLSRIPGMGMTSEECMEPEPKPPNNLKSTDTPFQTRSKMNGSHDLLYHHDNPSVKREPKPYPRCEWFYVDDQQQPDYKKVECPHEFKVPDYMAFIPGKVIKQPCVDRTTPPPFVKPEPRILRKKLPDNRPGYAEYTRPAHPSTIANREYPRNPKVDFPKYDVSRCPEKTKRVMEHSYARDYDAYRKQWNQIKYHETLRQREQRKRDFKEMTKDLNHRVAVANQNRINGIFPFA